MAPFDIGLWCEYLFCYTCTQSGHRFLYLEGANLECRWLWSVECKHELHQDSAGYGHCHRHTNPYAYPLNPYAYGHLPW